MKTTFHDLTSLNKHLSKSLDKIHESQDEQAELTRMVQVIRQYEKLLYDDETYPLQVVTYLKLIVTIRVLSKKSGIDGEDDLDKISRVASQVLTQLIPAFDFKNNFPSVQDDPAQMILICDICSKLPQDKIPLLKQVLEPIMKTPMDLLLQQFYERLASFKNPEGFLKFLKGVNPPSSMLDVNTYYELLASWLSQKKMPLKRFGLSEEAMLALAPHLTFLDLREEKDYSSKDASRYSSEFLGKLLAKTKKLETLRLRKSKIDGAALSNLRNTQHLTHLSIKDCASLNRADLIKFLNTIYVADRDRAIDLAQSCCKEDPISESDLFLSRIEGRDPAERKSFQRMLDKISLETLETLMRRHDIPYVNELVDDPLQQLCIYNLCARILEEEIPMVRELLQPLMKTPMDAPLLRFYESIPSELTHFALDRMLCTNSDLNFDRDIALKFYPYLSQAYVDPMLLQQNLDALENTGLLDQFLDKFPDLEVVSTILSTDDLFSEDREENKRTIQTLFENETQFNKIRQKDSKVKMSVKTLDSWTQKPAERALIKLHFHDFIVHQKYQEILLRTFPPGKLKNIPLYPVEYIMDDGENELEIYVVPTTPVAGAVSLLKGIINMGEIEGITVHYYGSPGADHSGLGRQFVSELMQGFVVHQTSLFTKTSAGGMCPYDPTQKHDDDADYQSYTDLGEFLGLTLKWEYPIGRVLSEKVLNCMLSFTLQDLLNEKLSPFDFIKKMDDAALIHFMRESTPDDEESIKLYEKVFLSDSQEEILEAAALLGRLLYDDDGWIKVNTGNIVHIRDGLRSMWVEDHRYYLCAAHAMAQGMMDRLPRTIANYRISEWGDVCRMGAAELSKHLQGELSAQYLKEHIKVRIVGDETPEKRDAANNVRKWTDEWIDANGDDTEKLANFVEAFSGARAMTQDILLDINPNYHTIEAHTCFYRADIPPDVKEGFLKLMWDDFALGDHQFNRG